MYTYASLFVVSGRCQCNDIRGRSKPTYGSHCLLVTATLCKALDEKSIYAYSVMIGC